MYHSTARRPNGILIIEDPIKGRIELDTLTCCHCGVPFIVRPGSGTKRGFCLKCMKPTCGNPKCDPCLSYEKKLEIEESRCRH